MGASAADGTGAAVARLPVALSRRLLLAGAGRSGRHDQQGGNAATNARFRERRFHPSISWFFDFAHDLVFRSHFTSAAGMMDLLRIGVITS